MNEVFVFVGGILDDCNIEKYLQNSLNTTNFAAHNYFNRIINEAKTENTVFVCTSPYLGKYKVSTFLKTNYCFTDNEIFKFGKCSTRMFSRFFQLKPSLIKAFNKIEISNLENKEVIIFVTQPNYFYISAALEIKKKIKKAKLICFVPDLTKYSNMSKQSFFIKTLKKIEAFLVNRQLNKFDAYIFFTKHMSEIIKHKKPSIVLETVITDYPQSLRNNNHIILYTGTINKAFNVLEFVRVFLKKSGCKNKLYVAGKGEDSFALQKIEHPRFKYFGALSPSECKCLQQNASVVVNPRMNLGEYVKYSFPSKIGEYLSNNGVVACFKLSGVPDEYDKYLQYPKENTINSLVDLTIDLSEKNEVINDLRTKAKELLREKNPKQSLLKIRNLIERL